MTGQLRYAYLDEEPVVFNDDKAFRLHAGYWRAMHRADAMAKAKLLTKAEFEAYAPGAPSLPIT